jgi:methionyl aminopeptidase
VCHGIPSKDHYLRKGDIINCDITVKLDGYHGDTSRTFVVGKTKPEIQKLVDITEQAMFKGIEQIKPGACISSIGKAIQEFVEPHKYGIVRQLTGHGIGLGFHEDPQVYHYYNPLYKLKLKPGMVFTVEPMLNMGKPDVGLLNDGWTVVTTDNKHSAQFEHTCLVTPDGVEILTKV